jgi:hypothetical protein
MSSTLEERRQLFLVDLLSMELTSVATQWILEANPYLFGVDTNAYHAWKHTLADGLGVDPREILLTGSACAGFSLSPDKNLRDFGNGSDVDVAVVSSYHFELGWRALRNLGTRRYNLTKPQVAALERQSV